MLYKQIFKTSLTCLPNKRFNWHNHTSCDEKLKAENSTQFLGMKKT